jgi:hypothetical protein
LALKEVGNFQPAIEYELKRLAAADSGSNETSRGFSRIHADQHRSGITKPRCLAFQIRFLSA